MTERVAASRSGSKSVVPAQVKGLSAVSFLNDFASEMVYPLLPAFITRTLGGGALALGALDGAADLTASILRALSGRWADRPGWQRPLIVAGYGIATAIRPLIAFAGSAWQVIAARVTDRIGKGLRSPARDAMIAQITPPEARGRAFGFHRAADHFGAVAGSLVAWLLLARGADVRGVIGWSAVPGMVAVLVLLRVLARTDKAHGADKADRADAASGASHTQFWIPIAAMTLLIVSRIPETLLLLRLQDLGVAVSAVPLVWAALHMVRTMASYPGGWLSDRIGPRTMLAAGAILFGGVLLILARELSETAAVTVFLALGLVTGLSEASDRQVVAALAQGGQGRAFGNAQALAGLAALPAGIAFGAVYQRSGGSTAFLLSAGAMAVSLMIWLVVTRRGVLGNSKVSR
ncbi:MAG TPA: MFS transporter [Gemmatimonadales bacterium]|nr:MFS transporter [Gemmatimonadales bacterium]